MLYSAVEMRSLHYLVLNKEVKYIKKIISFFDFKVSNVPVSKQSKEQQKWVDTFLTIEDLEALEKHLLEIKVKTKNIHNEIEFVNSLKNEK
jgi:hypothetical protein